MKKFYYYILAAITIIMVSCAEENNTVKPTSIKINGQLGNYFEVVEHDYTINEGRVAVEFKRIKEGLPLPWNNNMQLGVQNGCFEPQFMIDFIDEEADVVAKDATDIVADGNKIGLLMQLQKDETTTMMFTVGEAKPVGFRVSSACLLHNVDPCLINLSGNVGPSMIVNMSLVMLPDGNVMGAYYHKQFGPEALLYLLGEQSGDDGIVLKEFAGTGNLIGKFDGIYKQGVYRGAYESFDGRKYDFVMDDNANMTPIYLGDIDFGRFGSLVGTDMEGYENFYKEMFENEGIIPFASDTMTIALNKQKLQLKVGEMDTLVVVSSLLEGMKTSWISSDESVAMVGASGVVRAIGEGEAVLTCNIDPLKGNPLTTTATIKVKKAKNQSQPKPKSNNLNLGFATYEPLPQNGISGVKNDQPHGNGIMRFKSSHIIPGTQDCMAEPGEWVNGMWRDGKINAGTWYRNDGNQVIVKLGQRYNK